MQSRVWNANILFLFALQQAFIREYESNSAEMSNSIENNTSTKDANTNTLIFLKKYTIIYNYFPDESPGDKEDVSPPLVITIATIVFSCYFHYFFPKLVNHLSLLFLFISSQGLVFIYLCNEDVTTALEAEDLIQEDFLFDSTVGTAWYENVTDPEVTTLVTTEEATTEGSGGNAHIVTTITFDYFLSINNLPLTISC